MAQLTLKILGKTNEPNTGIDAVIQRVTKDLKSIENTKVKITVDSKDIDAAVSKLEKAAKAVGGAGNNGAAKQMQELGKAAQKTGQQIQKASEQADKFVQSFRNDNALPYQTIETLNKGIGQSVQLLKNLNEETGEVESSVETLTTNYKEQRKYIADADAAYAKYVSELEKKQPETAIQKQINALTGVSNKAKSAADSAAVFEKALSNLEAKVSVTNKENERAARSINTLDAQYSNLIRRINDLKAQYPEGTFDNIEQQAREAREELRNLDVTTGDLSQQVDGLRGRYQDLSAQTANARTETQKLEKVTESLWMNIQKFARWYFIGGAFSSIVSTIRETVATMREVDDELVTIRKVTGFSDAQISDVQSQAYSTASKYGVGAADYLSDVAAFSRAGYKEQSAALAELSAKTQIVGDTTAEVANQFLLSVDAAYKYKGSIEALTRVLDGANELDNKYATSIEKIAAGMGIVAPVAAQVNVSIDELAAAIGTITAVTQRSGDESARALRALFLNIVGDTKTEIDEGVTWTTGEIAGLQDVLKKYSKDAYEAAQASGQIINPMEAIAGLAQSMKDGTLSAQDLMQMVSDLGGKLRSSQLLALIQNWDMYQSMLKDFGGAVGSADKEVQNALDSWSRKTEILRNKWTEFWTNFIDSKTVKEVIDALTALVDILAAIAPLFTLITGPLKVTVEFISKFIDRIKELAIFKEFDNAITKLEKFAGAEKDVADSSKEASDTVGKIVDALVDVATVLFPLLWGEWLNPLLGISDAEEEVSDKTDDLVESQTDLFDILPDVTSATEEEKSALEKLRDTLDDTASSLSVVKTAFDDFKKNGDLSYSTLSSIIDKFSELNDDSLAGYITRLTDANLTSDELQRIMGEMTLELVKQKIETENLTEKDQALVEKMLEEAGVANASEVATSLLSDRTKQLKENTSDATREIDNFNNTPVDTTTQQNAVSGLSGKFDDLTTSIHRARWELDAFKVESGDESRWQINKSFDDYAGSKNYQKKNFQNVVSGTPLQRSRPYINPIFDFGEEDGGGGDGGGGSSTTENHAVTAAKAELQARKDTVALLKSELTLMQERGDATADIVAKMREIQAAEHDQADYMRSVTDLWDELGIDQGDINALSTDWWKIYKQIVDLTDEKVDLDKDELDNISAKIALEKQNLSFLESSGASTEQQIAQIKVIQAQLHIEAEIRRQNLETLKETAATEAEIAAAEKEIVALSTEWWSYQQKIVKLEEEQAKQAEEARKKAIEDAKKQALELLEAEEEAAKGPLQEQLDILEAQRDALKNQNDEQEKLLAVEKARIALQNAQNERKIRLYNASTGDWEWMADASTVSGAQDALNKAEHALADYYANQQIEALKTQINAISEAYKTLRSAIEEFAAAILDGTMGYRAAVASLMGTVSGTGLESTAARAAGLFSGIGSGAGSSRGGSGSGAGRGAAPGYGLDTSIDYSLLMANAQTLDEFNHWANLRTQKIAAMGYDINALGWDSNEDIWKRWAAQHGYDRGGILRGMGGIKATYADEMVLPPEATAGLLNAERSGAFDALLAHLGIVTSAANNYAGFNGAVASRTSIGSQYNGPMYQFGDICMTEDQARSTTVYDLAQMARALSLHNNH